MRPWPHESYQTDASKVTRYLRVDWNLRIPFIAQLLGYPKKDGSTLRRALPDAYNSRVPDTFAATTGWVERRYAVAVPEVRGLEHAGGNTIDLSGGEPGTVTSTLTGYPRIDDGVPVWWKAQLTVEYETLPYEVLTDDQITTSYAGTDSIRPEWLRFTVARRKPAGEALTTRAGLLCWVDDPVSDPPLPVDAQVPRWERYMDLVLTWYSVPVVPTASFEINTVNDRNGTFYGLFPGTSFTGFAKETLLYLDCDPVPRTSPLGQRVWDITYRFRYRQDRNWNEYLRYNAGPPRTLKKNRISVDGTSATTDDNVVFPLRNHHALFQV